MKIIALLPFKNEGWILQEYVRSINKVADLIIAFDDNSTDNSRSILEDAGAQILHTNYQKESGWAEFEIRQALLEEGRKAGGTHFICLDADEIFTDNFFISARQTILSLKPGQSLWMDWITLYGNKEKERVDGVYNNLNKSFIFCDEPNLEFKYVFLGVSRTPTQPARRIIIERKIGAVIHFQYLNLERSSMKRAWYMCSEHIKGDRSAKRINATYDTKTNDKNVQTRDLSLDLSFQAPNPSALEYTPQTDWRFLQIIQWFDKYGIQFFEPLDIWSNTFFLKKFEETCGKKPIPQQLSSWFIKLNNLKNKIKNLSSSL